MRIHRYRWISQRHDLDALEAKGASNLEWLKRSTPDQPEHCHSMATKQLGYFVHGH
jgi:hypothetical protein